MIKTKTSCKQNEKVTEKLSFSPLSNSLTLVEDVNLCESLLRSANAWAPCVSKTLSLYPESAKAISVVIQKGSLGKFFYQDDNLIRVVGKVVKTDFHKTLALFLSSPIASSKLLESDIETHGMLLAKLLEEGINGQAELSRALESDESIDAILFLFSIGQQGVIPFALSEGNLQVISSIKRLIECNIPKTLVCQIKSQLHELCTCPDLVLLLKSSFNNRKHYVEVKLQLAGIKNKQKLDKFVASKKKVKILFNKLAKPIEPISKTIAEIKKKLSDKKSKSGLKVVKHKKKVKVKIKLKKAKKINTKKVKKKESHKKTKAPKKESKAKKTNHKKATVHKEHAEHHKAHKHEKHHSLHAHHSHSFHRSHPHVHAHAHAHHHHHHHHHHHEGHHDHGKHSEHNEHKEKGKQTHQLISHSPHLPHRAGKGNSPQQHSFFKHGLMEERNKHYREEAIHHYMHQQQRH